MRRTHHTGAMGLLSLCYRGSRGMALAYHEVFAPGTRRPHTSTQIALDDFEAQIRFVASTCHVMQADDFVAGLNAGRLPARACLITFDDGFADNVEVALPVLECYGLPATFFIASGYVASGRSYEADAVHDVLRVAPPQPRVALDFRPWGGPAVELAYADDDRRAGYFEIVRIFKDRIRHADRPAVVEYLAERLGVDPGTIEYPAMMTPAQVRSLSDAGMTIGSHTEWHASLEAEGVEEYARQLRASRETLQEMTGRPVRYFSYPFGDPGYCVPAASLVREAGYEAAFMACGLPSRVRCSPWLIDRLATSGGMVGLWASLMEIKPSQFRQRRALARCLAESAGREPP